VVLCTWNGEKFLAVQLDSLLAQTRPPDLLVVGDDGSSDGTADILQAFSQQAPFPVIQLSPASDRLGPAANFGRTLLATEADWYALCDQDDIWLPNKLESLEQALLGGAVPLAFSDAILVDAEGKSLGQRLWQRVGLGAETIEDLRGPASIAPLLKRFRVMGAAMSFTDHIKRQALPIPADWPHDAWIASIAAAMGPIEPISTPLLRYRQHDRNAVGAQTPGWISLLQTGWQSDRIAYLQTELNRHTELLERLEQMANQPDMEPRLSAGIAAVVAKIDFLGQRLRLPNFPLLRWPAICRMWRQGAYRRWSTDWRSLALDLVVPNHKAGR